MIYTCPIDTPLGPMTAAAKDEALIGLWFVGQRYYPGGTEHWIHKPDYPVFTSLISQLGQYFSNEAGVPAVPLAPSGTPFQKMVWDQLLKIPLGHVVTYGQIAESIAAAQGRASMSAQAVGNAVGHNPISILIPCHRVVGANGDLTGYAGGLHRKAELLRIEKATCNRQAMIER